MSLAKLLAKGYKQAGKGKLRRPDGKIVSQARAVAASNRGGAKTATKAAPKAKPKASTKAKVKPKTNTSKRAIKPNTDLFGNAPKKLTFSDIKKLSGKTGGKEIALREISRMPTTKILSFIRRNDPSGYKAFRDDLFGELASLKRRRAGSASAITSLNVPDKKLKSAVKRKINALNKKPSLSKAKEFNQWVNKNFPSRSRLDSEIREKATQFVRTFNVRVSDISEEFRDNLDRLALKSVGL